MLHVEHLGRQKRQAKQKHQETTQKREGKVFHVEQRKITKGGKKVTKKRGRSV